ncbi:MAG: histidine kinase dimerization and phosphoacceptor region [Gemmatimonadetes bacterium]|nr:histidine kinase dimerization and phosphoacceptor region [Gemmatimonadota bacterium]
MHVFATTEIAAALFQAAITLGMAGLFLFLYSRYRKPHFFWWAVAWGLYGLRLVAIISFLSSTNWAWLYWHQVATGWTALGLLWAALVFSRQLRLQPGYILLLLVPLIWSYVAIFRLDNFVLAAVPAVLFLSGTTLWTGWVFLQYRRRTGSTAGAVLAGTFLLWGAHHLDYPLLRARGAWNPWGYYLDTVFLLAVGAGVLLLVIEELRQGVATMAALSGDLQGRDREDFLDALLQRPLALQGVRGAALFRQSDETAPVRCVGDCLVWDSQRVAPPMVRDLVAQALRTGHPVLRGSSAGSPEAPPFTAVLPLRGSEHPSGALVIVGDVAAPFAALDDRVLVAVGDQIGAALENAELNRTLQARTADLERLSVRMIQQHEEQRQRLARELHDETAQVFSALKLQLGSLRESSPAELAGRFEKLLELVDAGRRSIRNVTEDLRPSLLDDLGLIPALRALVSDFREWSGLATRFSAPDTLPPLTPDAELALFRSVQEGLSNVARHANAEEVSVTVSRDNGFVRLAVSDDGIGLTAADVDRVTTGPGHSGLFGMRERITALGGTVRFSAGAGSGMRLDVELPTGRKETTHG